MARFGTIAEIASADAEALFHAVFIVQSLGVPTDIALGGALGGPSRIRKQEALITDHSRALAKFCLWRERTTWAFSEGMRDRASPLLAPPMPWRAGDLVLVSAVRRAREYQGMATLQASCNSTTLVLARKGDAAQEDWASACRGFVDRCGGSGGLAGLKAVLAQLLHSPPAGMPDTARAWRDCFNYPGCSGPGGAGPAASPLPIAATLAPNTCVPGFSQFSSGTQAPDEPVPFLELQGLAGSPEAGEEEAVETDYLSAILLRNCAAAAASSSAGGCWLILDGQGAAARSSASASPPPLEPALSSPEAAIAALLPILCTACGSTVLPNERGVASCANAACRAVSYSSLARGFTETWVRFQGSGLWARCPQRVLMQLLWPGGRGAMDPARLYTALCQEQAVGGAGGSSVAFTQAAASQAVAAQRRQASCEVLSALKTLLFSLVDCAHAQRPQRWLVEVKV